MVAVGALWWLNRHTPEMIGVTEKGLVLRHGACKTGLPATRIRYESLKADVLDIDRTLLTMPDGSVVVDERIHMPENDTFGKAVDAIVQAVFHLESLETVGDNGKAALYEGTTKEGRTFGIVAVYKGKADLELLYPLGSDLMKIVSECLLKGRKSEGPTIVNRVVESKRSGLPLLSDWNEKLFTLGIIVNKDM